MRLSKDKIKQVYNESTNFWASIDLLSDKYLSMLKRELLSTYSTLEIGCGTGKLVRAVQPYVANIIGIDISDASIALAQKLDSKMASSFMVMDAEHMLFDDNSFNAVFAYGSISHNLCNPDKTFPEIKRVLKKGGFFYGKISYYTCGKELGLRNGLAKHEITRVLKETGLNLEILSIVRDSLTLNSVDYSLFVKNTEIQLLISNNKLQKIEEIVKRTISVDDSYLIVKAKK